MKKCAMMLLAVLVFSGGWAADALAGSYISGNVAGVFVEDSDLSADGIGRFGKLSYDEGYGFTLAFGHAYQTGLRAELELNYRNSELDKISVDGVGSGSVDGDVRVWGGMVNLYYDFPATQMPLRPFVGAGIGYANLKMTWDGVPGYGDVDGDDDVLAYQVMIGCGFALNKQLTLDMQYRYFATDDPEFGGDLDGLESEYKTHNVLVGLRLSF